MKTIDEEINELFKQVNGYESAWGRETLSVYAQDYITKSVKSLITTIIKESMPEAGEVVVPVLLPQIKLNEQIKGKQEYRQQLINNLKERGVEV